MRTTFAQSWARSGVWKTRKRSPKMFVRLSKSKVPGKHARGAGKLDPVREHRSQTRGGRGEVTFLRGAFGKPFPEGIPRIQGLSLVKREFVEKGYGASLYEPGFHGSPAKAKKRPPPKKARTLGPPHPSAVHFRNVERRDVPLLQGVTVLGKMSPAFPSSSTLRIAIPRHPALLKAALGCGGPRENPSGGCVSPLTFPSAWQKKVPPKKAGTLGAARRTSTSGRNRSREIVPCLSQLQPSSHSNPSPPGPVNSRTGVRRSQGKPFGGMLFSLPISQRKAGNRFPPQKSGNFGSAAPQCGSLPER